MRGSSNSRPICASSSVAGSASPMQSSPRPLQILPTCTHPCTDMVSVCSLTLCNFSWRPLSSKGTNQKDVLVLDHDERMLISSKFLLALVHAQNMLLFGITKDMALDIFSLWQRWSNNSTSFSLWRIWSSTTCVAWWRIWSKHSTSFSWWRKGSKCWLHCWSLSLFHSRSLFQLRRLLELRLPLRLLRLCVLSSTSTTIPNTRTIAIAPATTITSSLTTTSGDDDDNDDNDDDDNDTPLRQQQQHYSDRKPTTWQETPRRGGAAAVAGRCRRRREVPTSPAEGQRVMCECTLRIARCERVT